MVNIVDKRIKEEKPDPTVDGVVEQTDTTEGGAVETDQPTSISAMSGVPTVHVVEKQDPATELINKVFKFVVDQPEFYMILQLSRPERKMLAKRIAKVITTFPHFKKVDNEPEEG